MTSYSLIPEMEGVRYLDLTCAERTCYRNSVELTDHELGSLNELRERARVLYDESNIAHTDLLRSLWGLLFTGVELGPDCKSQRWKEVGFQGTDPATDFRGAGVFGLQQLVYMATIYPVELREVLASADYPFAISALNVSYFLMCMFQLTSPKVKLMPEQRPAPARYMKSFSVLQLSHSHSIDELYCAAVLKMHSAWLHLRIRKVNLMEFDRAIQRAKQFVFSVLSKSPASLDELKETCVALRFH